MVAKTRPPASCVSLIFFCGISYSYSMLDQKHSILRFKPLADLKFATNFKTLRRQAREGRQRTANILIFNNLENWYNLTASCPPWTYGLWRDCKKETHILKQFSFINFEVGPPTLIVSSELQPRLINSFAWPKDSNNSNQVFTFSNLSLLMNKTKTLAQPSKSIRVNVSWIEHNLTRIEKLRNSKRWPSWAIVSVFVLRLKHSKLNRLGSSLWWWHTCSLRWC